MEQNTGPRNRSCAYSKLIFFKGAKQYNDQRWSFQQMVQGQLDIHMQKMNLDTALIPFTKINSSRSDLYVKYNTMRLLKGKKNENLNELCDGTNGMIS